VDAIENRDLQIVFDVPVGRQGGRCRGLAPYRDGSGESICVIAASLRGGRGVGGSWSVVMTHEN